MTAQYRISFTLTVLDPQALWSAANETLPGVSNDEVRDWIGTHAEPDVLACLYQLYDPDNLGLKAVAYVKRDGARVEEDMS